MFSDAIGRGGKFVLDQIVKSFDSSPYQSQHPHFHRRAYQLLGRLRIWLWQSFSEEGSSLSWPACLTCWMARLRGSAERKHQFGAFYDSVIDRYSDIIILQGLMVYYARKQMLGYVVLVGIVFMGAVLTSYARARAESLIPILQDWIHGASGKDRASDHRRLGQPDGSGSVDFGRAGQLDGHRPDLLHLERASKAKGRKRIPRPRSNRTGEKPGFSAQPSLTEFSAFQLRLAISARILHQGILTIKLLVRRKSP